MSVAADGSKGMAAYLREVRRTHPLSREEERRLGVRIRQGDVSARNELVTANLRFGVAVAKSYLGRGVDLEELISAANQGLIEAAERYDSRNGARFVTYASWWIRRCVSRTIGSHDKLVHVPAHVLEMIRKVQTTANGLHEERERKPTVTEIADRCGEPDAKVRAALENVQSLESLDRTTEGYDEPERRLAGELHDPVREPPTVLDAMALRDQVGRLLEELDDRERAVVRRYYGIDGGEGGNLAAIGRDMGLSRERVRQIKSTAISRMKSMAVEESVSIDEMPA